MQQRWWDYKATLSYDRIVSQFKDIIPCGIYYGCDLSYVSGDAFSLAPGKYVMPHGLIVEETTAKDLSVTRISGVSVQSFTLVSVHNFESSIKSSRVDYTFLSGTLTQDEINTLYASTTYRALLIAWIMYDGSVYSISLPSKVSLASDLQYKFSYFNAPFYHAKTDITASALNTEVDSVMGPCFKLNGALTYEMLIGFHDLGYLPDRVESNIYGTGGSWIQFSVVPNAGGVPSTYSAVFNFDTDEWMDILWDIPAVSQRLHCGIKLVMTTVSGASPKILLPYIKVRLKNISV